MLIHSLLHFAIAFVLFPAPRDPAPDDRGQGFFGVKMVDGGGVSITHVEPRSPADKAGVRVNDIITSINSINVPTTQEAREIIAKLRPGSVAQLEVRRGDKPVLLKLRVGSRTEIAP